MKRKQKNTHRRLLKSYSRMLISRDIFKERNLRKTRSHWTVIKKIKVSNLRILMKLKTCSLRLMLNWLRKEETMAMMTIFVRSHPKTDEKSNLFN
jgi:hypothetical protein